jgi:hypothetical protein
MLETDRIQEKNRVLEISIFLLLFGLSLGHFSIVFAEEHQVYSQNNIHFLSGVLFSLFTLLFLSKGWFSKHTSFITLLFMIPVTLTFIESIILFEKSGFLPEQIIEHALKIMLPLIGMYFLSQNVLSRKMIWLLKLLIACTFLGHGVYALGFHYVPGNFMLMTTTILGINPVEAEKFLYVIGLLDIIAAVLIFVNGVAEKIALIYMIVWGLLTAIARFIYGAMIDVEGVHMLYYVSNTLYRLPHGLIPLYILIHSDSFRLLTVNKKTVAA